MISHKSGIKQNSIVNLIKQNIPAVQNELSGLVIIFGDIRLRAAKSQINDQSKCTGNIKEFVYATGSVTRLKSPEWLYKAVRGILYFRKSSFDHCLIIILRCFIFIGCFRSVGVTCRTITRTYFQHISNRLRNLSL